MKVVLGTRGSELALWQTRHVERGLVGDEIELRVITTQGDRSLADRLVGTLEKGFFTEELEAELRASRIDAAVHSLKDLPTRLSADLTIGAILERAPAGDLLITHPENVAVRRLPLRDGCRVGASSLRRDALLRHHAPLLSPEPLRGNVPTRLAKLRRREIDAIVLAAAGVLRLELDLSGLVAFNLDPHHWMPAPGQGAIAVECRTAAVPLRARLSSIHHSPTARAVEWERAFLRALEGGCTTPFGCYTDGKGLWLGQLTGGAWHTRHTSLPASSPDHAFIAAELAALAKGTEDDDDASLFQPLA